MNTFAKRLQTRASRKGIKLSMQQVRDVYQSVVNDLENPTTEEMDLVLAKLESSFQEIGDPLAIPEPVITNVTNDSNPDIWEILQPNEDAIASDLTEPEEKNLPTVAQESSEVQPIEEATYFDEIEPEGTLTKTDTYTLQEIDKRSIIQQ